MNEAAAVAKVATLANMTEDEVRANPNGALTVASLNIPDDANPLEFIALLNALVNLPTWVH